MVCRTCRWTALRLSVMLMVLCQLSQTRMKVASGGAEAPQEMSLSIATGNLQAGSKLQDVLAANKADFERELRGKLPDMMQTSLAGLLRPWERRQAELNDEHQQLRREVGRMHEAHTKESVEAWVSRFRASLAGDVAPPQSWQVLDMGQ